jgi:hypothetical protein
VTTTVTTTVSATTTTSAAMSACTGTQLLGTFTEAPGGGGAGQIEYILTLTNTSSATCTINGLPAVVLLDKSGGPLPTKVTGTAISPLVAIAPGHSATATARFSPDVPGKGDSQSGACQPKAYTLRVTPNGGGTVNAPIKPPTSVCERGTLNFSVYGG